VEDADDLIPFQDVRVLRTTPPALLCGIGSRRVWLPRGHVSGKLWAAGDRGKLFVRRWVARDRQLIDSPLGESDDRLRASRRLSSDLHLERRDAPTAGADTRGITRTPRILVGLLAAPGGLVPPRPLRVSPTSLPWRGRRRIAHLVVAEPTP
jgi:hypothetical protein